MKYKIIDLPYTYDSLEPYLDKKTVEVHYSAHHKGYEQKLLEAIKDTNIESHYDTLEKLMKNYDKIEDPGIKVRVRQFGGGLINHNFLWPSLKKDVVLKDGNLKKAIISKWGSIESFKEEYKKKSLEIFGSGWAWLVKKGNHELEVIKTFNQDNPWFEGYTPIIGIDVWEHAYYLKHQSKRADYFEDMWKIINWDFAETQFNK